MGGVAGCRLGFALVLQAVEVFTRPKDGDGDYRM